MGITSALITPSFRLDFERCALLTESVERFVAPCATHYLIVDRRDVPLFRSLESRRTRLVIVEEIVPRWIMRIPGVRRFWLSFRGRPIKNWILQQIVKLSVANVLSEDVFYFVDSDVFFVAPFDPAALERDGQVPLFVETGKRGLIPSNDDWHRVASRLLGLPAEDFYDTNFIGNVICWRRENVLSLHRTLEARGRKDWELLIAPLPRFSEYILYGLYATRVLGMRGHYADGIDRTLTHWEKETLDAAGLAELKARLGAEHHSVMVSAKSRTPVEAIRAAFARRTRAEVTPPLTAAASSGQQERPSGQ
jgi:hypothetical protein